MSAPFLSTADSEIWAVYVPSSIPEALLWTVIVPPLLPFVLDKATQERSADACQETGRTQFPVSLRVIFCPGGLGCNRVAVNVKLSGVTRKVQGAETVNVTLRSCGLFSTGIPALLVALTVTRVL